MKLSQNSETVSQIYSSQEAGLLLLLFPETWNRVLHIVGAQVIPVAESNASNTSNSIRDNRSWCLGWGDAKGE